MTGFVGPDRQPIALSQEEVDRLLRTVSEEAVPVRAAWNVAETVRITSEPFDGIHGKVVDVDVKREKLKVLVSIFGRETPVRGGLRRRREAGLESGASEFRPPLDSRHLER